METTRNDVLAMERRFWEESGPQFFREAMDDKAITIMEPMGMITKDQAVEMSKEGESWDDVKMHDVKVVELTPDCVALAYHGEGKGRRTGKPYRGSISSVYVRRDGDWKLGMTTHQPWGPEASKKGSVSAKQ